MRVIFYSHVNWLKKKGNNNFILFMPALKIATIIVLVLVALTFCITTSLLALTYQVINGA
jgi:hypothetical protein